MSNPSDEPQPQQPASEPQPEDHPAPAGQQPAASQPPAGQQPPAGYRPPEGFQPPGSQAGQPSGQQGWQDGQPGDAGRFTMPADRPRSFYEVMPIGGFSGIFDVTGLPTELRVS